MYSRLVSPLNTNKNTRPWSDDFVERATGFEPVFLGANSSEVTITSTCPQRQDKNKTPALFLSSTGVLI